MKKDNQNKNKLSDCTVTINIKTTGNVNIYNCSKAQEDKNCGCKDVNGENSTANLPIGACVPMSLGAKPKQSQKSKLDRLLKNNAVPSVLAATFMHVCKRFIAGKSAGSELETKMFEKLRSVSPESKKILECIVKSSNSLPSKYKKLFAGDLAQDIDIPITGENLSRSFGDEITAIVGGLALETVETLEGGLKERPGKMRLIAIPPGEEVFESQVRIFKINELRTYDYIPRLRPADFLPEELQQICTPRENGDRVEWDCEMQEPPCDGFQLDNNCLRVQQIQSGTSITLEGVNFFDINSKVQFRLKQSTDPYTEVDAFVYGDVDTPLTEIINGTDKIIVDSRVHDKIFAPIPLLTTPGIYEFMVVVPNTSGLEAFGDKIISNVQYIEVVAPSTSRFQITTERLWARKETSPESFGSDEVGIKTIAIPIFDDMSLGEIQNMGFRFGNVDSGQTRVMDGILFSHNQALAGVILSVIGFEIDGEDAYTNALDTWWDVVVYLVGEQWRYIAAAGLVAGITIEKLFSMGFWGAVLIGLAMAITFAIDALVALWAPADPIIEDTIGLSVNDLARLTNINVPTPIADPNKTIYTTPCDIKVRLMLTEKIANQYKEERGYLSDDEDSWYNIKYRYNRIS